ncbi:MAG: hypothetical protein J6H18_04385 [Lachnospiraceae bacterium]|nr:hypothetical protein [Lachnospiraceae bacterium]
MASTDLWQLYRIADSYYRQSRTQEEISRKENISRSQVSRLLDKARALGIVKIEVTLPEGLEAEPLRDFLRQRLNLEALILVPVEKDWDENRTAEAIARTAALRLPRLLKGARVVGTGWGETMYRTAAALSPQSIGGEFLVVPLIGTSGSNNPYLQINTIINHFSEKLGGDGFFANLPAFREKNVPFTAYENKRLNMLHEYWTHVDAAVFGLGSRDSGKGSFDEEVSLASQQRIWDTDVVGDVLAQFFFEDGSFLPKDGSYHTTAFPAERLKHLPRSICLAGGPRKAKALLAGARSGFFKTLITDTRTAALMYEKLRSEMTQ